MKKISFLLNGLILSFLGSSIAATGVFEKNPFAKMENKTSEIRISNGETGIEPEENSTVQFSCDPTKIGCFTSIIPTAQTDKLIIAQAHEFQLIFKQGDAYTIGSGTAPGNNDFTGYVPINGSSTQGYVSINHENTPGGVSILDVHYDQAQNLWVVDESQAVDLYNNALVTTARNCSGGVTPWGTVITAEESTNDGDVNNDGYQDVGWLVEIDPATAQVMDYGNGQEKLWAMGRMNHENVVITADGSTAYYGEDGGTDCVYKFVADTPGDLSSGTLYVLKLDAPMDANNDPTQTTGEWIQVPNTTKAEQNNVTTTAVALSGTSFNGVEDCEIDPLTGMVYFTAKGYDKVYRFLDNGNTFSDFETFVGGMSYDIQTEQGTISEPWGNGNDNLTFDDQGNLWVLQDGGKNYIWVVRPAHTQTNPQVEIFASMPSGSEPTGLTFTPDYKYGFFSIQHPDNTNSPQPDASGNNVVFDVSATVVFSLKQNLGLSVNETVTTDISVFPNPTRGKLNIQLGNYSGENVSVEVFDLSGRKLIDMPNASASLHSQKVELDLSNKINSDQLVIVRVTVADKSANYKVLVKNN